MAIGNPYARLALNGLNYYASGASGYSGKVG
jgi:hypothetical protein